MLFHPFATLSLVVIILVSTLKFMLTLRLGDPLDPHTLTNLSGTRAYRKKEKSFVIDMTTKF